MLLLQSGPKPYALLEAPYVPMVRCAGHLDMALDIERLTTRIDTMVSHLSAFQFDSIAFCGLSGALVAPIVAYKMGKTLLAVRKEDEDCHSCHTVEGDMATRRYLILDDFISSGNTVDHIFDSVQTKLPHAVCIGVYEYLFSRGELSSTSHLQYRRERMLRAREKQRQQQQEAQDFSRWVSL